MAYYTGSFDQCYKAKKKNKIKLAHREDVKCYL